MIVLGIDPGLLNPAFVILDKNLDIVSSCVFHTKLYGEARKQEIYNKFKSILTDHTIDLVVIEGYSYMSTRNMKTLLEQAELTGMMKAYIFKQKYKLIIVPPSRWKKYALGKGNVKKPMIPQQVYKIYKKEFKSPDEVDAFCIATVGVGYLGKLDLKEYQIETIKQIVLAE